MQKKKLVYLKIFFPVGEKDMDNTNKTCPKKLIIEMLFEIFFNLFDCINNFEYFKNLIYNINRKEYIMKKPIIFKKTYKF